MPDPQRDFFPFTFLLLPCFTQVTISFQIYGLSVYGEPGLKVFRNVNGVKRLVMEVYDSLALNASEMLMNFQVGVEPLGVSRAFDDEGGAEFAQGQQRPIDRIEGNAREGLSDLPEHRLGARVLCALEEGLVDRHTLWSDLATRLAALGLKGVHLLGDPVSHHCACFSPHVCPLTGLSLPQISLLLELNLE